MSTISNPRHRNLRALETNVQGSRLMLATDGTLTGFVFDEGDFGRRYTVEILLDGSILATTHAAAFVPELAERGVGDGCFGFTVSLDPDLLAAARMIEARIANVGRVVGLPIDLAEHDRDDSDPRLRADLRWLGGIRFSGWIDTNSEVVLEALVDGEIVSQLRALNWTRIDDNNDPQAGRNVRAFDFHLPERFADGRIHRLTLRRDNSDTLPVATTFVAFPDGLVETIAAIGADVSEQPRGKLYDQVIPASLPLADYPAWCERFRPPVPSRSGLALAVVVAGSAGADQTVATLESQSHQNWTAGVIDGPPLAIDTSVVTEFLRETASDADVLVMTMAGVALAPDALGRIAAAFDANPGAVALYGDLDYLAEDGRLWPIAFPAFDYERMLEQGYCCYLFAIRRDLANEALQSEPESLYRFFNVMLDGVGSHRSTILHLPGSLGTLPKLDRLLATSILQSATHAHLRARGVAAEVSGSEGKLFPAVRVQRALHRRKTTVVIPTRDRLALLSTCLESIAPAVARSGAEILIIDNDSTDPNTLNYLGRLPRLGIKTLRIEGPFNFARLNNQAAAIVDSDALCLLNNDVAASSDDWLEEMLSRLEEPDVGAVGALLTWPGGVIQHGGVVLGINFAAAHAFTDRLADNPGYLDLLRVSHECSAVTAACLLTRRTDYIRVGGMDETHFAVAFNDVDYCLRLRELGKRIVLTPHARLVHAESASRGKDNRPDRRDRFERELNLLRTRWGEFLIEDPTYNPQLSRDGIPYGALAWPPGEREARLNRRPQARDLMPGL